MTEPSEEVKAMARRIAAETKAGAAARDILQGVWDDSPLVRTAHAAMRAEREQIAAWLDRLSNELVTPDFLAFVGDPFGHDGQGVCADLAQRIRTGTHYGKAEQ